MARPALSATERALRRAALLQAAQQLYRARGELPTVADIALAAGMAKGAVYLWFRTKEALFVALLGDSFERLFARLLADLEHLPAAPIEAGHAFAEQFARALHDEPDLLPLAAQINTVLARALPHEAVMQFKHALATALTHGGALLEARFPTRLAPGDGAALLIQGWSLALGLWQSLDHPPALDALLHSHPALAPLRRDFATELHSAVLRLWHGALIASPP